MFRGTFTARVDDKGRLKLPAAVKQKLEEKYGDKTTYFVTSMSGETVLIYGLADWERIQDTLAQTSEFGKSKRRFLFLANHYGAEAPIDEQGRLLIPSKLREGAGMKGEVMLTSQLDHVEVLSQARYDQELEANRLMPDDYENLSKLGVFG